MNANELTVGTTLRILKSQAVALKQLQASEGVSASALVRVLLTEFFEGRIPQVRARGLLLLEQSRATEAAKKSQFQQSTQKA